MQAGEMTESPFLEFESAEMAGKTAATEGEDLELECSVTGSPPPIIQWFKDGKAILLKPAALGTHPPPFPCPALP